jgi:Tol biopolymer transport system component
MARTRLGGHAKPDGPKLSQIVSGPNADDWGRVSGDERYLSFTGDNGDLALYEFATGTHRRLTNANEKKGIYADDSIISPDGKLIAYTWRDRGETELRIANSVGSPNPRRLHQNPEIDWYATRDWSPDGKLLAVQIIRKDQTQQIGLINIADGSLRVLKSLDWRGIRGMFFSPDGKYLGYDLPQSDAGQKFDIFVLSMDGSREIPVVVHRADDLMMGWSPDGKRLIFASDRSGTLDLWGVLVHDGKPQGAPELLKAAIGRVAHSNGVTRSGALFYMTNSGSSQPYAIRVAEYDSANRKRLSAGVEVTDDDGRNRGPVWSPNGKYLAHMSQRLGPGPTKVPFYAGDTLVIRSAETYEVVHHWRGKLSYVYAYALRWMPDSRSILVRGTDLKGRTGIFQIEIETGNVSAVRVDQPGGPQVDMRLSR